MRTAKDLTPEQLERYNQAAEIMASWALDGMYPSEFNKQLIWEWILGEIDLDEFFEKLKKHHGLA